jgi:hypothetical protein
VNGDRPRGHTSLTGAADAQIAIRRDEAGKVVATVERMKDGAEGEVIVSRLEIVDVGVDGDGEPLTSCIVREADGAAGGSEKRRLAPAQARALQLLADAISVGGQVPPGSHQIPAGASCVTTDVWRECCYRGQISDGNQHAKKTAFNRAAQALVAAGRIGVWDPWVWIASP